MIVRASFSTSESFANTSIRTAPLSVALALSFIASGASFTGFTVKTKVLDALAPQTSVTVTVNDEVPYALATGVICIVHAGTAHTFTNDPLFATALFEDVAVMPVVQLISDKPSISPIV